MKNFILAFKKYSAENPEKPSVPDPENPEIPSISESNSDFIEPEPEPQPSPGPDNVITFKITEFTGGGINSEWIGTYEQKRPGYYQHTENELCYLSDEMIDNGFENPQPTWVFYNYKYTSNPYYFTRNENPFTTTEWVLYDGDPTPVTVKFADFTY